MSYCTLTGSARGAARSGIKKIGEVLPKQTLNAVELGWRDRDFEFVTVQQYLDAELMRLEVC